MCLAAWCRIWEPFFYHVFDFVGQGRGPIFRDPEDILAPMFAHYFILVLTSCFSDSIAGHGFEHIVGMFCRLRSKFRFRQHNHRFLTNDAPKRGLCGPYRPISFYRFFVFSRFFNVVIGFFGDFHYSQMAN